MKTLLCGLNYDVPNGQSIDSIVSVYLCPGWTNLKVLEYYSLRVI